MSPSDQDRALLALLQQARNLIETSETLSRVGRHHRRCPYDLYDVLNATLDGETLPEEADTP